MVAKNGVQLGRDIIKILESFGEMEWYKYGPIVKSESDLILPHVTVWRYKERNEYRDQLIGDAIKSFNGKIQWTISSRDRESLPGRNWWIAPKQFKDFLDEIKDNPDIIDAKGVFADAEPEVGKAANQELPDLAEHIKNYVRKGLSVTAR